MPRRAGWTTSAAAATRSAVNSRIEHQFFIRAVKTVFKSPKFDLTNRLAKDYNVDTFAFDATVTQIPEASFRKSAKSGQRFRSASILLGVDTKNARVASR